MISVLMVGGGSAGHIAPMIAVAEALEASHPNARVSFVCSDKPSDAAFLALEKRTCDTLPLPKRSLALPFLFARGVAKAFAILRRERPDVVFSKGSAVSVPLCLAAWTKRVPVVLHESDGVMGWANRIVSLVAAEVLHGPDVGNPIRARITQGKKEEGLRVAGLDGTKPVLLVMGGSQGAASINEAVTHQLDALLKICDVIHLTGKGKSITANKPGYYATEFGSDVLPHLYAATDLAVSRAGAGSIAELGACGIPSILVPIRGLAGDHQVRNAERATEGGGAVTLAQEKLNELSARVTTLLSDRVSAQTMGERARYAAKPDAARRIAETVFLSVARKKQGA